MTENATGTIGVKAEKKAKNENRNYKDKLFRLIFGGEDKSWTLSLYNAVNRTNYENEKDLVITTLDEALCLNMKNDLSFLIADTMNLYEHQSTFNPNMPMRMFFYAGSVYTNYIKEKELDLHDGTLQRIPAPRMVVFYNGDRFFKDKVVMKLSDAYMEGQKGDMEVEVTMLNINYGSNRDLMKRCRPLCDYFLFTSSVRKYRTEGKDLNGAIGLAIGDLPDDSPIRGYLLNMGVKMINECLTAEFAVPIHEKNLLNKGRAEGLAEGREAGKTETKLETARRMLYNGKLSLSEVAECSGLTLEEVQKLAAEN